jgi:hypothetical protein
MLLSAGLKRLLGQRRLGKERGGREQARDKPQRLE